MMQWELWRWKESYFLQFHLMVKGCLLFGNMQLKAKKQLSNVKARKGSLITFFLVWGFFFFPFFLCTPPAGGWGHLRTSLIRKSKITPSFSLL